MTITGYLQDVLALVRRGWTRNVAAKDKQGRRVTPTHQGACRWCLTGAMERVSANLSEGDDPFMSAQEILLKTAPYAGRLPNVNDRFYFRAEVEDWIENAIKVAAKEDRYV